MKCDWTSSQLLPEMQQQVEYSIHFYQNEQNTVKHQINYDYQKQAKCSQIPS